MAIENSVGARLQSGSDSVNDARSDLDRRYANVRAAMAEHSLDGLVVAGSEYSGFEGAVTYLTGFQIVHRYAYVVVPADGDPFVVFPAEARYVGEHGTALVEQRFDPHPGAAIAAYAKDAGWKRIGVYGLDYVMTVRDYRPLEGFEVVPFDVEFDLARAVKSEAELESVRDSVRINRRGFEIWADAYAPGRSAAEVMAVAEEYFVAEGCGRLTMNMVLTAPGRSGVALPEFKIARKEEVLGDFVLPSLEVAGPGMHWVEVSRAVASEEAELSDDTRAMAEAYDEYFEAAKGAMRDGATCHDVHMAVSKGFSDRGYHLGHVTGHSIGMTMIEFPKVGEGVETELRANMVLSMHPHAIAANGEDCLYMQDTWLVTPDGGVPLAGLAMEIVRR
jgi:Xaa-Pro aminopeptidase